MRMIPIPLRRDIPTMHVILAVRRPRQKISDQTPPSTRAKRRPGLTTQVAVLNNGNGGIIGNLSVSGINQDSLEQLAALYRELHLSCERAAAALRLAGRDDAPVSELMDRFEMEERRAAKIWEEIRSFGHLDY
jgi:hypothetical protein